MSIRIDKEKIIREIMDLRTLIGNIHLDNTETVFQLDDMKKEMETQLNKIHDMVFGI